jgi:hypothetical protein
MAFNRIALVSCVINVQKPSTIYSAACLVGRSGPWSISLGDGGSLCCCLRLRSQIGGSRHVNGWSSGIGRLSTLVLVSRGIWLQRNNRVFNCRAVQPTTLARDLESVCAQWCRDGLQLAGD